MLPIPKIADAVHIVGESQTGDSDVVLVPVLRVDTPADSAASLPVSCTNSTNKTCPCNPPNFCESDKYFTTCCTANFNCKTVAEQ